MVASPSLSACGRPPPNACGVSLRPRRGGRAPVSSLPTQVGAQGRSEREAFAQAGSTRAGMAKPPPRAFPPPVARVRYERGGSAAARSAEHNPSLPRRASALRGRVTMMMLERLVAALGPVEVLGRAPVEVRDLAYDARAVDARRALLLRSRGAGGRARLRRRRGGARARSRSSSSGRSTLPVPQVVVAGRARRDGARRGRVLRRADARSSPSPAVTGTSGKTTTAFLLFAILAAAGRRPGLLGTVEARVGGERRGVVRTTPEAIDLQRTVPRDARRRRPLVRDGGVVARVGSCTGSTASASPPSSSRTSARTTSTSTATWSRTSRRSAGSSSTAAAGGGQRRRRVRAAAGRRAAGRAHVRLRRRRGDRAGRTRRAST